MFKKSTWTVLAAGLLFGPLPVRAAGASGSAALEQTGKRDKIALPDKEKPSKPKEKGKTTKEKKKKYDDFKDENGNGIDDRFEKPGRPGKDTPKKQKTEEPGEANF